MALTTITLAVVASPWSVRGSKPSSFSGPSGRLSAPTAVARPWLMRPNICMTPGYRASIEVSACQPRGNASATLSVRDSRSLKPLGTTASRTGFFPASDALRNDWAAAVRSTPCAWGSGGGAACSAAGAPRQEEGSEYGEPSRHPTHLVTNTPFKRGSP